MIHFKEVMKTTHSSSFFLVKNTSLFSTILELRRILKIARSCRVVWYDSCNYIGRGVTHSE